MQEPIGKQLADGNKGEKIMTNEQLTQEVLKLAEHQAKCDAERENMLSVIEELREDIKATKSLAEDVHILAINMKSMQKTMDETNRKVDALSSQEFLEYKENKKTLKKSVLSAIGGSLGTGLLVLIIWFLTNFVKGG